jgi:hypothetical protein
VAWFRYSRAINWPVKACKENLVLDTEVADYAVIVDEIIEHLVIAASSKLQSVLLVS